MNDNKNIGELKITIEEGKTLIAYLNLALKNLGLSDAKNIIYLSDKINVAFNNKPVVVRSVEDVKAEKNNIKGK